MKRMVKLAISAIYIVLWRGWAWILSILSRHSTGTCVVIYYHDITAAQRPRFARQLDMLLACSKPIAASYAGPLVAGNRYVAVTFDDGYDTLLQNALPELEKRQVPATIFAVAGRLGEYPGWPGYPGRFMSAEQLRSLPAGLISIGSHTMTHPRLTEVSDDRAWYEISESRSKLEAILGRRVALFSFPQGAYYPSHISACRQAGYERAFTILPRLALRAPNEYLVGRVSVEPTDWAIEFRLKLMGAYRWLPYAFRLKQKLKSMVYSPRVGKKTSASGYPAPPAVPQTKSTKTQQV